MIPLSWFIILSAVLFSLGIYMAVTRRNTVFILMGIELMLNAVNINLLAFWRYRAVEGIAGQAFAIIVFAVAAAEVAVGLSLIISIYRRSKTVVADDIHAMEG